MWAMDKNITRKEPYLPDKENMRYKIVKYYQSLKRKPKTIKAGLTLEEAKKHCQLEETHKIGEWFDGFTKQ
jgi:hypothetical protein